MERCVDREEIFPSFSHGFLVVCPASLWLVLCPCRIVYIGTHSSLVEHQYCWQVVFCGSDSSGHVWPHGTCQPRPWNSPTMILDYYNTRFPAIMWISFSIITEVEDIHIIWPFIPLVSTQNRSNANSKRWIVWYRNVRLEQLLLH